MRNMFDIGNETVIVTTEIGKILVSETELPLESRCFRGCKAIKEILNRTKFISQE